MLWKGLYGVIYGASLIAAILLLIGPRYRGYYLLPARVLVPLLWCGVILGMVLFQIWEQWHENQLLLATLNKAFFTGTEIWLPTLLSLNFFIAAWIAEQSDRLGIGRIIQTALLLLTLLFAPLGLMFFYIFSVPGYIRLAKREKS